MIDTDRQNSEAIILFPVSLASLLGASALTRAENSGVRIGND
jgi:hypothetical protein